MRSISHMKGPRKRAAARERIRMTNMSARPHKAHLDAADANHIALLDDRGVADFHLVHERSVRAAQIFEHPLVALEFEPGVLRREERVVERDLAVLQAAPDDVAGAEREDLADGHAALPGAQHNELAVGAFER